MRDRNIIDSSQAGVKIDNSEVEAIKKSWTKKRRGLYTGAAFRKKRNSPCVIVENCNETDALALSALFYSTYADRDYCMYKDKTLKVYCGHDSSLEFRFRTMVTSYFTGKTCGSNS